MRVTLTHYIDPRFTTRFHRLKVFGAVDMEVDVSTTCPPVPRHLLTALLPEYDVKAVKAEMESHQPHWLVNAQKREIQRLEDIAKDLNGVKFIATG